ncbi:hypothetical protein DNU06_17195 [Putridiphycobacter roseus]|uniref:Uncharacterized protein n=1 Tax=Putridiphycobacter roseus TaxID=2219161 RepID=A0A2W1MYH8_9FLAO|nr:hypothetical protein [Putridiphycobacter roseus]PZE15611.1 hypothetical protein DNU06_17195 [Putridiphycobacter roseus]
MKSKNIQVFSENIGAYHLIIFVLISFLSIIYFSFPFSIIGPLLSLAGIIYSAFVVSKHYLVNYEITEKSVKLNLSQFLNSDKTIFINIADFHFELFQQFKGAYFIKINSNNESIDLFCSKSRSLNYYVDLLNDISKVKMFSSFEKSELSNIKKLAANKN